MTLKYSRKRVFHLVAQKTKFGSDTNFVGKKHEKIIQNSKKNIEKNFNKADDALFLWDKIDWKYNWYAALFIGCIETNNS